MTNYHLVLPHLLQQKVYRDFYISRGQEGHHGAKDYVILDNGIAEGMEIGAKHLMTLAEDLRPHEIVVPDTMGDSKDTLAKAQGFARYAEPDYKYMFVLQGSSPQEVMQCLYTIDNSPWAVYITTLGIPRHLGDIHKWFRISLLEQLLQLEFHNRYEIHFLGSTKWSREVVILSEMAYGHENIRGIDTSYPVYIEQDIRAAEWMPRPRDYFHSSRSSAQQFENVHRYLDWAMYDADH